MLNMQKAKKKRVVERKERRKSQNKAYYLRHKWGISLTHDPLSKILDTLLSKIPDTKVSGLPASEAQLNFRLQRLNRK
ncbi:hypothetical protein F443_09034 [Phytophthora nicotianae P1569]|uniref:Uncharacterized protein n=1 Tax=Phytophthora nicotianae P1569 TaxID=1317065 RepID=V9F760_PHYNI|nr:hypothetical protein F443_09034 [Phytophthora nicotianae P1569]